MYKMDSEPLSSERGRTLNEPPEGTARRDGSTNVAQLAQTVMSITCHLLLAGFTIYILYLSFRTYSLFSWHPACLTVGMFLLMSEAVMAMSPNNILTRRMGRQAKVQTHWILQAFAAALIFAGFLVIVINKNKSNAPHFKSNHGLTGLISIILFGVTSVGGLAALYCSKLKDLIRPALVKLMHGVFGIATTIVSMVCIVLGIYSNWFKQNGEAAQIICTIVVVIATVLTLQSAAISAFGRIKRMVTGS